MLMPSSRFVICHSGRSLRKRANSITGAVGREGGRKTARRGDLSIRQVAHACESISVANVEAQGGIPSDVVTSTEGEVFMGIQVLDEGVT
jgi:hypothetical protein